MAKERERMSNENWKALWAEKEASMPINFGRYIGTEKEKDPGAESAAKTLQGIHTKLLNDINAKKRKEESKEIQDLEIFLTTIFFPKEGDNGDLTRNFLNLLIKGYEKVYDDKIQFADNNLTVEKKKLSKAEANTIAKKIKKNIEEENKYTKEALVTIQKHLNKINSILESRGLRNSNTGEIYTDQIEQICGQELKQAYEAYDKIVSLYGTILNSNKVDFNNLDKTPSTTKENISKEWGDIMSTMLISEEKIVNYTDIMGFKEGKAAGVYSKKVDYNMAVGRKKADLISTLRSFETFRLTLEKLFEVTPATYGNVLEYGIALIGELYEKSTDEKTIQRDIEKLIKKDTEGRLQKAYGKVTGQTPVSRGGSLNTIAIDAQLFFDGNDTAYNEDNERFEDISYINRNDEYGNISFATSALNRDINTGKDSFAKLDVTLTLPDTTIKAGDAAGKTFKISAKNWGAIDNPRNDLGTTSLLRAIDRTTSKVSENQEGLLNYLYAMQQPISGEQIPNGEILGIVQSRRSPGNEVLKEAHRVAKDSLLLDIAIGYSQGDYSADTLVIMDRKNKRVVVIDMIEEAANFLNGQASRLMVSGYDSGNIESAARLFRNLVRAKASYVARDRNYISLMKLFLEGQKATVKLNRN